MPTGEAQKVSGRATRIEIDVSEVRTAEDLHLLLKQRLGFPSFYGCNWDAFWDSITGVVEMPLVLQFTGWARLDASLPRDAKRLKLCLVEMQEEFPSQAPEVIYA